MREEPQSAERLSYVGDVAPRLAFLPKPIRKERGISVFVSRLIGIYDTWLELINPFGERGMSIP